MLVFYTFLFDYFRPNKEVFLKYIKSYYLFCVKKSSIDIEFYSNHTLPKLLAERQKKETSPFKDQVYFYFQNILDNAATNFITRK